MNVIFKTCIRTMVTLKYLKVENRCYARWTHRRPLKVIPPEEFDGVQQKQQEQPIREQIKIKWRNKVEAAAEEPLPEHDEEDHPKKQKKGHYQKPKPKSTDMLETVIDAEGNFVYTKMNNNDPRVGTLLTTVKSKKEKSKKDLVLLEGKRLIKEALVCGCTMKYLIFTRKEELEFLKSSLPKSGAKLYKMPYREMQMWSQLTTCPGVMGIFRIPEVETFEPTNALPLTIICDNIREPGNLGSIMRAAAGVGCQKLILTKGCVNLWDTKVTRSAAGSHFRIKIHDKVEPKDIIAFLSPRSRCFIADNNIVSSSESIEPDTDSLETIASIPVVPYYSVQCSKNDEIVLIIGGETKGISLESYKLTKQFNGARLNIPLENGIESLNAGTALGIISFEFKKQLNQLKGKVVDSLVETDVSLTLRYL